jgi:Protein of unknown function (DUF3096)
MHRTQHRSDLRVRFSAEKFCKRGTFAPWNRLKSRFRRRESNFVTVTEWRKKVSINIGQLQPIVALVAGVLILIMPRLLNYIVALYLILVGILGLGIIK